MNQNDAIKHQIVELMAKVIEGINKMEEITQQNIKALS